MSKSQWSPAEGVIVDVQNAFGHHEQKYTIEARKLNGPLVSRIVKHKAFPPYDVGTKVKVQISDHDEIRFDPDAPGEAAIIGVMNMSDQIAEASAAFRDHPTGSRFTGDENSFRRLSNDPSAITFTVISGSGHRKAEHSANSLPGVITLLRQHPDATLVVMTGSAGREVVINRTELSELAHAMTSTKPGARRAAVEEWHKLRAKVTGPG